MRLGGFLVSPEEIEAVIQAQPGVAAVQVVSACRGAGDPVPVAFELLWLRAGAVLQEAALRASCLQQLARFKVPERIVMVEDFPIVESPNGAKVQKVRLREMAEALLCEEQDQASEIRAELRRTECSKSAYRAFFTSGHFDSARPPERRSSVALFCYRRSHLEGAALAVAATCDEEDLVDIGGPLGRTLFLKSRNLATPVKNESTNSLSALALSLVSMQRGREENEEEDAES